METGIEYLQNKHRIHLIMKKILFLFCFGLFFQLTYCQISNYSLSSYSNKGISIDLCKSEFNLSFYFLYKCRFTHGKIEVKKNIYTFKPFFFNNIQLKKIDKYRLLVLNNSIFFKKNQILYCNGIYDCKYNRIEEGMAWENGLREFSWEVYTDKGRITTEYKKGKMIKKYFKTYKQIDEESSKFPKM